MRGMNVLQSVPFNQREFEEDLFTKIEKPFSTCLQNFTTHTAGDTFKIATDLYNKYGGLIKRLVI